MDIKKKIDEKDLQNPEKVKETFIENLDANKKLRMEIWRKLYTKSYHRESSKLVIMNNADDEWLLFDYDKKSEWYDFVKSDDMGFIQEILMICDLIKINKGNMKNVWRGLKEYGKNKHNK